MVLWVLAYGWLFLVGVVGILVSLRFGFWYFGVWFSGFLGADFWFGVGLRVDLLLSCYGGVVCDWLGGFLVLSCVLVAVRAVLVGSG